MGKDSFSGLMESTIQEIGEMVIVMEMEYGQINMEIAITVLGWGEEERDMESILLEVPLLIFRTII